MRDWILHWIARAVWRTPILIFAVALALAIVGGLHAHRHLQVNADTNDLISPNRPFMQAFNSFMQEFGDTEYIYVVVASNGDQQRTEACVDAITAELRKDTELPGVYSGVTPTEQLRIASRAMGDKQLEGLSLASGAFPILQSRDATGVMHHTDALMGTLLAQGSQMSPLQQQRIGAAAVYILNVIASARVGSASAKELAFLRGEGRKTEYFKSTSGKLYFITIIPHKDYSTLGVIQEPLRRIHAGMAAVQQRFPDVEMGLTGKPVLQADEMATTDKDMTHSAIAAFILCSALLMVFFRSVWRPLLAAIAFACGVGWTYGLTTVAIGQLNLLSIVFILVLVGVGLDYGVHIISRYREHRVAADVHSSITYAIMTAGRGNITGSLSSAVVFFMAYLTSFQGLRELGGIAGGGLLLCMIAMTVVLPALLVIASRWRKGAQQAEPLEAEHPEDIAPGMLRVIINHPGGVLLAVTAITLGLGFFVSRLHFEQNLLKLQAVGLDSVKWQHRISEDSASNTWFGVSIVDTLEQAHDVSKRARSKATIGDVHSVLDIVKLPTPQREAWRARLHEPLPKLQSQTQPASSTQPGDWTVADLQSLIGKLDLMTVGAALQAPEEAKKLRQISDDLKALAAEVEKTPEARQRIEHNINAVAESIAVILAGDKLDLRDALPDGLRQQFMSPRGKFAVMIHPRDNVWEFDPMVEFVADMRAVDPNVTGVPITQFESMRDMNHAFGLMSVLAVVVILVIVAIDFRKPMFIALALVPMALGTIWTVEIMGLLNISFNLANFFSAPILIGLSVNGSVYVIHRYREGGGTRFTLGATRRAVILTSLTTFIGFGSLVFAHHLGLRSLGQVMAIGTLACLLATIVVLPALLVWLERRRGEDTAR